mmetsp:Transcript_25513/g.59277  ORF Transcript_25513/g.59277 Transcript_25513/m.59277 type:complete len:83 (+) Transcript_25513:22-270(+)
MVNKAALERRQKAKARREAGPANDTAAAEAEDEQRNMVGLHLAKVDGESGGLDFDPWVALMVATVFISSVIALHIIGKLTGA